MSDAQMPDAGTTQNTGESQPAEGSQQPAAQPTTALGGAGEGGVEQQGNEGKVTDGEGDPAAGDDSGDGKGAQEGAPETYEAFKAPDGTTLDDAVMAEFSNVAKELNLSQDAAQKMVDSLAPKIAERQKAAFDKAINETRTQWVNSVKADKEFGGEKLNENLSVAKKALDKFGSPELRALLEQTGLGDNPEIIRAFYRAGKAISEDVVVPGGTKPAKVKSDPASALYGN